MNSTYFMCLTIGAVFCTGLFAWKLRRNGFKPNAAFLSLPLGLILGLVTAKVSYFFLDFRNVYGADGWAGLLTNRPVEFSFVGGAFGVVLAVLAAAKIARVRAFDALDAFAPCGALMAAVTRACEGLLDPMALVGMGDFVADESLWFFPVAVENAMFYSWFYAVFMLEAGVALICAAGSFALSHKRKFASGRVFLQTVFFLALPQIFSERMLNQCMKWGFVRIEQLLCALIVFAVVVCGCVKYRGRGRFLPALLMLACAGVIICIEFTLDNKPPFGIELSTLTCYVLMILTLCCMAGLNIWTCRRLKKAE